MYSNKIIFLTILFLIISLSNAKTVFVNNNFELTGENASVFLHPSSDVHSSHNFGKREMGTNCVLCKFGLNPCCEPNTCIKKSFWPDECMEIKQAQGTSDD